MVGQPQLFAAYHGEMYRQMALVLYSSALEFIPDWRHEFVERPMGEGVTKTTLWRDAVRSRPDGTRLLLLDADMLILRDLDAIWDFDCDLVYTVRRQSRSPWIYNCGVVAVRVTPETRAFMELWAEKEAALMQRSALVLKRSIRRFGHPDQEAFHRALRSPLGQSLKRIAVKCQEWNCVDSEWRDLNETTRILHIKGALRAAIFGHKVVASPSRINAVPAAMKVWKAAAKQAGVAA